MVLAQVRTWFLALISFIALVALISFIALVALIVAPSVVAVLLWRCHPSGLGVS